MGPAQTAQHSSKTGKSSIKKKATPQSQEKSGRRVSFGERRAQSFQAGVSSHELPRNTRNRTPSPGSFQRGSMEASYEIHGVGVESVAWRHARAGVIQVRPALGTPVTDHWLVGLSSLVDHLTSFSDWKCGLESNEETCKGLARRLEHTLTLDDTDAQTNETKNTAQTADVHSANPSLIKLSLRLERLSLEDAHIASACAWCLRSRHRIQLQSLWLFDNRCTDAGAAAVAQVVSAFPEVEEVHLSHNRLTVSEAIAVLDAVPVGLNTPRPRPLWLRLEWNRIQLQQLGQYLERAHTEGGLLVDIPVPLDAGWCAPFPDTTPDYLVEAVANVTGEGSIPEQPSSSSTPPNTGRRTPNNKLRNLLVKCHVRLPWLLSQFEVPSEAAVLQSAKRLWRGEARSPIDTVAVVDNRSEACKHQTGPLLLFPDTSVLLAMLGAPKKAVGPCLLTLEILGRLKAIPQPASDRVFIVISDSVMKQLDGMKKDLVLGHTVRHFFSTGLDAFGPAGLDIITVLGAHEGEGLLSEHGAEVTGSRSVHLVSKGQRADHRIVEVALFFQAEILQAKKENATDKDREPTASSMPVLLVSADNAQVHLARAHGLPAVRTGDLDAAIATVLGEDLDTILGDPKQNHPRARLNATALRNALAAAACAGLGARSEHKSIRAEFRACIELLEETFGVIRGLNLEDSNDLTSRVECQLGRWKSILDRQSSSSTVGRWIGEAAGLDHEQAS